MKDYLNIHALERLLRQTIVLLILIDKQEKENRVRWLKNAIDDGRCCSNMKETEQILSKIFEPLPLGTLVRIKGKTKVWKGVWTITHQFKQIESPDNPRFIDWIYNVKRVDLSREWNRILGIEEIEEIIKYGGT